MAPSFRVSSPLEGNFGPMHLSRLIQSECIHRRSSVSCEYRPSQWTLILSLSLFFFCLFVCFWHVIALQCCVHFCCARKWLSHCIHIYSPSWSSFPLTPIPPSGWPLSTKLSPLYQTAASHWLPVLHLVVGICWSCSPHSSRLLLSRAVSTRPRVLCVCVSSLTLQIDSPVLFF